LGTGFHRSGDSVEEIQMRIWGAAEERGAIWGAIAAIFLFSFIFPDPDVDLGVKFAGNPPYGILWYLLNPFYWTKHLYPAIIFTEWALVTLLEWYVLKKNRGLVKLQIFSVAILLMLHATQDVTVIMFAPFAVIIPMYVLVEVIQKIPLPGTPQWTCAFNGTGTDANAYLYPCLSNSTHFNILGGHVYGLTYILLLFWAVFPLLLWFKAQRASKKVASGCGGRFCETCNKELPDYILGKYCTMRCCVQRGKERVEKPSVADPPTRKQLSAPLPTKSVSRLDVLLLLTLGIIAHDVASIYGFHIPGYHAVYFAVPMVLVILSIKFGRRIRKWQKK
jgi:hypothetical protein